MTRKLTGTVPGLGQVQQVSLMLKGTWFPVFCQLNFLRHLTSLCASFVTEDDVRTDMCKHVTRSDRLLKKYAGDVFADTQRDEEFHSG